MMERTTGDDPSRRIRASYPTNFDQPLRSGESAIRPPQPEILERTIGSVGLDRSGPTLLLLAAMHGNEPAGVIALQQFFEEFDRLKPDLKGCVAGLIGNLQAYSAAARYLDKDLNRMWDSSTIDRLPASEHDDNDARETGEIHALLRAIQPYLDRPGPLFLVDLHTTSSESVPFSITADILSNRRFAQSIGLPVIIGLESYVQGTLINYLQGNNILTMAIEGGQHTSAASAVLLHSAIWISSIKSGCIGNAPASLKRQHEGRLAAASTGLPGLFDVSHRQGISIHDEFKMRAGYRNFSRVRGGELLANNREEEIRSPYDAYIFMPLYQARGNDGFFLIRPAGKLWQRSSALLRKTGLGRLLSHIPSLTAGNDPNRLLLERETRFTPLIVSLLRLCGYRRSSNPAEPDLFIKP